MPFETTEFLRPEPKRKRLAIISSWNENCGNASYTFALKNEFARYYDVEILALDLFMLQRPGSRFARLANKHIEDMAKKLADFDYVNIQFEAGLYGARIRHIRERLFKLIRASRNLILTMHRVDIAENSLIDDFFYSLESLSFVPILRGRHGNRRASLYADIIGLCRKQSLQKNVWIMVHTKRERRLIEAAFRMKNCVDYPLCFLDFETRARVAVNHNPDIVRQRYALPSDARMIGAFGYVSDYKAFETLLHAISVLPKEWYLLVVGSQHPQTIKRWLTIDPYLALLLREIEGRGITPESKMPRQHDTQIRITGNIDDIAALREDARALMDRVRFLGTVDDDEFTFLLRNVDATVLPYLEVGQSMSGVVALAVESGARLFCSNNLSFGEARKYYGRVFGAFDIGNYVEIAQKVQFDCVDYSMQRDEAYRRFNITKSIDLHRHLFEHGSIPTPKTLHTGAAAPAAEAVS